MPTLPDQLLLLDKMKGKKVYQIPLELQRSLRAETFAAEIP
jgi:hypothetical protein